MVGRGFGQAGINNATNHAILDDDGRVMVLVQLEFEHGRRLGTCLRSVVSNGVRKLNMSTRDKLFNLLTHALKLATTNTTIVQMNISTFLLPSSSIS